MRRRLGGSNPLLTAPRRRPTYSHSSTIVRMTIQRELAQASPHRNTVVSIGTFDGVHLGHRQLLHTLKALAARHGLMPAVLTFRNHPRLVLDPGVEMHYITGLPQRVEMLQSQVAGLVIPVEFTRELSLLNAPDFLSLLSKHLKMKGMVVGPDFALGHRREGNVSILKQFGLEMGFWVETVEPVMMDQTVIRSSLIRSLLTQGEVENAGLMLGRCYSITGVVTEGDGRGQQMGFPTANLSLDSGLVIPGDGIYATWATVAGQRYQASTCIGVRPTFGLSPRTVEAFILDFQGDIYGESLTLEFVGRLRDERAFPNVEKLIDQIKLDVDQTRAVLSNPTHAVLNET